MGNLPCAKVIIDNGRGAIQALVTHEAVVDRALGCMANSVLLGATDGTYPTSEMQERFLKATENYKSAMTAAADPLLSIAAEIAKHCYPGSE